MFFRLSNLLLLLLKKRGYSKKMVLFHQLESKMTNLSLDLEWFPFLLVEYITFITKQTRVLQENGIVSPVGIHSDQFKFGIRMVSFFVSQIYCGKRKIYDFFGTFIFVGQVHSSSFRAFLAHTKLQFCSRWWLATNVSRAMDRDLQLTH